MKLVQKLVIAVPALVLGTQALAQASYSRGETEPHEVHDRASQRGPVLAPPLRPTITLGHYEVPVIAVRAVKAPPQQRCWVEREQVSEDYGQPSVGGAILGGVIGGLLGRQIGRGGGRDMATVGGAVAGAAIGAHVARTSTLGAASRDVQRCETVHSREPAHWDVTYMHAGVERHVQLPKHPGRTIRIQGDGQPML